MDEDTAPSKDHLDPIVLVAIVIGSTGFLLMVLGAVFYLSRLGDVPSTLRKSVEAATPSTNATNPHAGSTSPNLSSPQPEQPTPIDELIEIYAPAGKLGIILETPGDGPPFVHQVRPNSVLRDQMQVGDRIIALDDEDVRNKSANKVSKMISRKMENTTRKFTVIRTAAPGV